MWAADPNCQTSRSREPRDWWPAASAIFIGAGSLRVLVPYRFTRTVATYWIRGYARTPAEKLPYEYSYCTQFAAVQRYGTGTSTVQYCDPYALPKSHNPNPGSTVQYEYCTSGFLVRVLYCGFFLYCFFVRFRFTQCNNKYCIGVRVRHSGTATAAAQPHNLHTFAKLSPLKTSLPKPFKPSATG